MELSRMGGGGGCNEVGWKGKIRGRGRPMIDE